MVDIAQIQSSVLPNGAATEAKQPALGTAGAPSADVITIQGDPAGTAIPVTGTVTSTISGTVDTEMSAAAALSDSMANPTAGGVAAHLMTFDISGAGTWRRLRGNDQGLCVQGWSSADSAFNGRPLVTAGTDGGNVRNFRTDTSGRQFVIQTGLDASGTNRSVSTTTSGSQIVAFDPGHVGAFGDLIAEQKSPLFGKHFGSDVFVSQLDATAIVTSGVADINANRLRLQTGTTSGASATYNSVKIATYREGMGMQFRFTAAFTTGVANSLQQVGAFTPDFANGYGFGYNGINFAIFHRNGGADSTVANTYPLAQASWNGSVPSGFDPTKGNVYRIDYPFLGFGDVRFYIQDATSGQWHLVHTIRYANASTTIQLAEPALQFCARALSVSSTTNLTVYVGSYAAFLIGELVYNGPQWSKTAAKTSVASATSVLAVRNCTTFNGKANKRVAHIRSIASTVDAGNGYVLVRATVNPTLGGTPAFSPFNGSTADDGVTLTNAQSVLSFDTAGTTVTGGTDRWGNVHGRNSSSTPVDVTKEDLFINPGETWVFEFAPSTSMDCAIAISGQED